MGKINNKQKEKEQKLLDTAFNLFISKGINETTIQDIVQEAGIAKGTFYLYFKDKYHIIEALILSKTFKLFDDAIRSSRQMDYQDFTEQFLLIIDYIINELSENQRLLKFIYKNLSVGVYSINFKEDIKENVSKTIFEMFMQRAEEEHLNLPNPSVTFFMIIELVGSTCYHAILFKKPLSIEDYKPYLYDAIRKLLKAI